MTAIVLATAAMPDLRHISDPETHYEIEAVKKDVENVRDEVAAVSVRIDRIEETVGERIDKVETSQTRHRTLFDDIRNDFRKDFDVVRGQLNAFMLQAADESGKTRTWIKLISVLLGLIAAAVIGKLVGGAR